MAAPTKVSMSGRKRKLENLSMDEFMSGGFESSSSESDKLSKKALSKSARRRQKKNAKKIAENTGKEKPKGVISKHKMSLEKLKDQDPEFFEFLKDEDESLLKFDDISGSDVSDTSDDDDTSKSDEPVINSEGEDDEDDDEEDFPMSSDEEISPAKITKFLEKKNKKEIEELKKKAMESAVPKQKQKNVKSFSDSDDKNLTKLKEKTKKILDIGNEMEEKSKVEKDLKQKKSEKTKPSIKTDKKLKDLKKKTAKESSSEDSDDESDEKDDDDIDEDMDVSDEEDSAEDNIDDEFDMEASDDSDEEGLHKPPAELEVMSDSDDDDDDGVDDVKAEKKSGGKISVTMAMIKEWTHRFKDKPSFALIHEAVYAFKAAVQHTAVNAVSTKYKVEGSKVYNAVVRMCLIELPGALQSHLDLPKTTDLQKPVLPNSKNQRWKKVRLDVKSYLADVLKLMSDLSEANMVNVLLKHVHKLVAYYATFPKLTKTVLKKCVAIWSSGEETSRVLAFLCINRLIRIHQDLYLENSIKQMYMAYVRNCKFTSPNTLPMINFMQRSFVEILALDFSLAYQYAFIYIRQLAIHLRNAITTKKKESCQAVYNWQFVHCIGLWSRVLSATHPNEVLEPLIYPLVQTIIGTIKLIPTPRYYPLRFHCVRALTLISRSTKTFIPVLPFLVEVFELTDFNKKHKSLSFKPVNFACILKFTKPQLQEKSFKDGVIDQLYELLLEHFHAYAHTISFPELVLPALLQMKEFLKKCKVGNFTKQIKQIVDKVEENSKFITARRRTASISLADRNAIDRWESSCLEAKTPLGKFYTTWRKLRDRELMHRIAAEDEVVTTELPEVKRPQKGLQKATDSEKKEFSALFDSDSDDNEMDLTESFLPPDEKKALQKEKNKKEKSKAGKDKSKAAEDYSNDDEDSDDNYDDFDSDELEQLAGSGSDDDDVEYDDGKQNTGDDNDDKDSDDGGEEEEEEMMMIYRKEKILLRNLPCPLMKMMIKERALNDFIV
ncbi:nucleolar complex protein 2 homolog isoform X2 [Mercenaria mercenaria]|uniref:nucleolar complex protein 2 homolog isoform X2 n=1 Tax=Mercenaria mercenaria TaxID=6596 RepID=UPI00234F3781|nr:nucleolar complex protein 2 homolog isoform X2 [Mercenaria mercenaria]